MRSRVFALTRPGLDRAREAVDVATPLRAATSARVAGRPRLSFVEGSTPQSDHAFAIYGKQMANGCGKKCMPPRVDAASGSARGSITDSHPWLEGETHDEITLRTRGGGGARRRRPRPHG